MQEWWTALTGFEQIMYIIAVPFTVILILQTILSIIGINFDSDIDVDMDMDADMDVDMDDMLGFKFFSLRGILAFFTIFGWVGIVLADSDIPQGAILFIATLSGLVAMFIIGWLFALTAKLQDSGNIDYKNAVGKSGEVYITIPKSRKGIGKIQITVQERLRELDALTDEDKDIKTGTLIKVKDMINNSIAVVERLDD